MAPPNRKCGLRHPIPFLDKQESPARRLDAWVLEPRARVIAKQASKIAGSAEECLSSSRLYKNAIAKLAWRPAKHVRDRGHVPFAAPRRLDTTLIEHVGN